MLVLNIRGKKFPMQLNANADPPTRACCQFAMVGLSQTDLHELYEAAVSIGQACLAMNLKPAPSFARPHRLTLNWEAKTRLTAIDSIYPSGLK